MICLVALKMGATEYSSLEYLSIQKGMDHEFYQVIDSRINKQKSLEISQLMQSEMVVQNIVDTIQGLQQ